MEILHLRVTILYIRSKKSFKPISVFKSKREDMIQSGSVFSHGNVNIAYVTSLIFDVIGRSCPKERQTS